MHLSQLFKELGKLTDEEYLQFRQGFITFDKERQARAVDNFRIGDLVQFQGRRRKHGGRFITIRIKSKGPKRLHGVEFDLHTKRELLTRWRVSPVSCRKVEEVTP